MKKTMKKIAAALMMVVLFCLPYMVTAQPPNPGCDPFECPLDDPACCVPIDGGLSLLIAAGIGLGAKKAYDRKRASLKQAE